MQSLTLNNNLVSKARSSNTQTTILFSILFIYFLCKTLYFALNIGVNISPDEVTWFGRCLIFSKFIFLPTNSPESYEYGLVTHNPYLYFWIMGKALHLNFFAVSDLVFLRCINICIGLATVWFSWKTILILTEKNSTRLLFIILCTNTLMLTFLNSFVSHDNLVNFFAVTSIYFLLAYFQHRAIFQLLLCILFILAGCLTKLSFLPFAILVFFVLMLKEYNHLGGLIGELKSSFLFTNFRRSVLMTLCISFLALNLDLHLGNIIKFRSLSASPEAVVGLENAMQYRIFARGHIVQQFKDNKLSLPDAGRMAMRYIKHEGDRNDALILLNIAAQEKLQNSHYRIDRFRYGFAWADRILSLTFGIAGHKAVLKTGASLAPYILIFLFAAILMIRQFRLSDMNGNAIILLVILIGYTLVLMQYVNYGTYQRYGTIYIALQGRYLFPVIYAGYALTANYLTSFKSPRLNIMVAITVAAVFIFGEFPWFLTHVTEGWFFVD